MAVHNFAETGVLRGLQAQSTAILEYDEKLVRRLVERITVFEDHLEMEFKSGVEFDIGI